MIVFFFFQSTEADHADNEQLVAAINSMTEVAGTINEMKHRKDLGKTLLP